MDTPALPTTDTPGKGIDPRTLQLAGVALLGAAIGVTLGIRIAGHMAKAAGDVPAPAPVVVRAPCEDCEKRAAERAATPVATPDRVAAAQVPEAVPFPDPSPQGTDAPAVFSPLSPSSPATTG